MVQFYEILLFDLSCRLDAQLTVDLFIAFDDGFLQFVPEDLKNINW